jgi:excisionase family DNA binding protein
MKTNKRTSTISAQSPPDMSIRDTAAYLKIDQSTVRDMIADGRLKAYKLGNRVIRLRRNEIDAALTQITSEAAQ